MTAKQFAKWVKAYPMPTGPGTQVAVAERLGLSERQIRRYMTGEHPIPKVVELATVALDWGSNV